MWQRTHTWRPCKTWGNPNDPSKGCTSSREEVRGQRVTLATALFISFSRFGHQDVITGLDSLSRECCVTAGGRDGTVRLWKIPEESQLVFSGHQYVWGARGGCGQACPAGAAVCGRSTLGMLMPR